MARKGENIYKRKDGRYEGRYVKYYEANGKPHWGYVYDRSYSVVKSKLSEKKANNRLFSTAVPTNLLLYEWIEMWIDAQRQIKLSTKTMYYSHLKNHIQGSIGNVMLKKLNSAMIQQFIDDESEKHSAKTVHTVFSMLRLALKAANDKGYIGKIYVDVRLPKIQKKAIRILSPHEQKRLEKVILECNNRYDIGILLSLYTGLRIGELCALRWECIDLKNATISIEKTAQRVKNDNDNSDKRTMINFAEPKSAASVRRIPIPLFLVEILKSYQLESGFILRNDGRYTDTRNISRRFKQLLELAEIPNLNYHITRHTFAARALELGMDIKTLSEILGHSSVTITLDLYGHSLEEHKRKEMEKFNSLFENPSE